MRVIVTLTIDTIKETRLEGEAPLFGNGTGYMRGFDSHLRDIGFWLTDWRYCQTDARPHKKSKVFVPWASCLMVETDGES